MDEDSGMEDVAAAMGFAQFGTQPKQSKKQSSTQQQVSTSSPPPPPSSHNTSTLQQQSQLQHLHTETSTSTTPVPRAEKRKFRANSLNPRDKKIPATEQQRPQGEHAADMWRSQQSANMAVSEWEVLPRHGGGATSTAGGVAISTFSGNVRATGKGVDQYKIPDMGMRMEKKPETDSGTARTPSSPPPSRLESPFIVRSPPPPPHARLFAPPPQATTTLPAPPSNLPVRPSNLPPDLHPQPPEHPHPQPQPRPRRQPATDYVAPNGQVLSAKDLRNFSRGVSLENGDTVYFMPEFIEEGLWDSLPGVELPIGKRFA
ncbi:hypothetical protein AJ80_09235 [Polytolypa hystricis UAMH7299]|uniref:Uncharacterized protein n=1 Tax=Polytolypa hystricis (strain UAMH7299) TaxID=1447883 RepID=A0A2B7WL25_POLH7|nr:hypothetical protein AJ80_09235 [Polytolypa hystricis UAMH7299]